MRVCHLVMHRAPSMKRRHGRVRLVTSALAACYRPTTPWRGAGPLSVEDRMPKTRSQVKTVQWCIRVSPGTDKRARERYGNRLGALIETAIAEFLGREEERAKCRELTTAQTWHDTGVCTD